MKTVKKIKYQEVSMETQKPAKIMVQEKEIDIQRPPIIEYTSPECPLCRQRKSKVYCTKMPTRYYKCGYCGFTYKTYVKNS